jgi:hypothetical protein
MIARSPPHAAGQLADLDAVDMPDLVMAAVTDTLSQM